MPDLGYLLSQLGNPRSIVDILVVTLIIYWVLWMAQGTRATQLIRGIAILLVVGILLASSLQLTTLNWVLGQAWPALIIAIPVLFAPEIRRALEQLGTTGSWLPSLSVRESHADEHMVEEVSRAAGQLARNRYGALMVIERETGLQNFVERGVPIDAYLTRQLLINIFYPNSPLHDGAVVIRNDRIVAASVVLPLTDNISASGQLGTRHRAAVGVSEVSDAVGVVVSEETGQIAVTHNGRIIRNLDQDRLRVVLRTLLRIDAPSDTPQSKMSQMLQRFGPAAPPEKSQPQPPVIAEIDPSKTTT